MPDVLLFDMHTGGHHLELAGRLQQHLTEREDDIEAEFLAPAPDEEHDAYFDAGAVSYLHDEDYDTDTRLSEASVRTRRQLVEGVFEYAARNGFDLVQFLQLDDIVRQVHDAATESADDPAVVGLVNGAYFHEQSLLNRVTSRLVRSRAGPALTPLLPEFVNDYRVYRNDVYTYRAMKSGSTDHLFVHAEAGRRYLAELYEPYAEHNVSVVPDPTETFFDHPEKGAARERLDLETEDPMLLFFGEMRQEKGIETLLEGLEGYNGPPFRMVIAGSQGNTSDETIERIRAVETPDTTVMLGFIPEAELPLYFRAADGVVCPYRRSFGRRRTSNVFQKAAGAERPVIVPDFGVFRERAEEWNLGLTFESESPSSLAAAMETFVERDGTVGDPEKIRAYGESITYESLGTTMAETYRHLL